MIDKMTNECDICGRAFSTAQGLALHKTVSHRPISKDVYDRLESFDNRLDTGLRANRDSILHVVQDMGQHLSGINDRIREVHQSSVQRDQDMLSHDRDLLNAMVSLAVEMRDFRSQLVDIVSCVVDVLRESIDVQKSKAENNVS